MNLKTLTRLSLGVATLALAGPALAQTAAPTATAAATGPRYGTFGVDLTARDAAVKPGDDFWTYANGNWDKTHADRCRSHVGGTVRTAGR